MYFTESEIKDGLIQELESFTADEIADGVTIAVERNGKTFGLHAHDYASEDDIITAIETLRTIHEFPFGLDMG